MKTVICTGYLLCQHPLSYTTLGLMCPSSDCDTSWAQGVLSHLSEAALVVFQDSEVAMKAVTLAIYLISCNTLILNPPSFAEVGFILIV